jgi:predicted metal-binding membrane protein
MTSAARSTPAIQQAIVLGSLCSVTLVAWMLLAFAPTGSVAHSVLTPHQGPFGLASYSAAVVMWLAMVVAMMLPPLVPWILGFAALSRRRDEPPVLHTHLFVVGYLAVWGACSLVAAWVQVGMQQSIPIAQSATWLAGASLAVAGAFQFTRFKCATLSHCRNPLSVLLHRWENGPVGALRLGWLHGLYCLGCCWALMTLALALGAMNLVWMAVLTLVIGVEKLTRHGMRWSRVVGAVMIVWGASLVAAGMGG